MSVVYIWVHFRIDFIMEALTLNPEQTAPLGVDFSCTQDKDIWDFTLG